MTDLQRAQEDINLNLSAGISRESLRKSIEQMITHLEIALTERHGQSLEDTKTRLRLEREMLNLLSK